MNYTSIEQSKKLLELGLDPESADMWYHGHNGAMLSDRTYDNKPTVFQSQRPNWDLPCWSVGALMELMPDCIRSEEGLMYPVLNIWENSVEYANAADKTAFTSDTCVSALDACYKAVVWLLENNYIKKGE